MKYFSCISKILFLSLVFFILVTPQTAVCENPYTEAIRDLASNLMYVQAWSLLPNDDLVLSLYYYNPSEIISGYNVYAKINSQGEYIIGPDSIRSVDWATPTTEWMIFDSSGRLFIYREHHHINEVFRESYDPLIGRINEYEFPKYLLSGIRNISNLPEVGNVVFSVFSNLGKPYKITIDNPKTNKYQTFEFDKFEGFLIFDRRPVGIYNISDTHILFIGTSAALKDSDGLFQVTKFVFNVEKQDIELVEMISYNDIIVTNPFEYKFPSQNQSTIFTKDGRIFFILPGKNANGRSTNFIIELDSKGNFVLDDRKASLMIEESALTNIPNDFLLFYDRQPNENRNNDKFWVMSLDNFPTLVLDKGE